MNIAIIDIIIIVIIALFVLRSSAKGFVSEFFSLAAVVFGLLFAILFFRRAALFISEYFSLEINLLADIISFVLLFLVVFMIIKFLGVIIKDIITKIKLTGLDRLLGFAYGLAKGIVVVYLLLFIIRIQPLFNPNIILGNSSLVELFMRIIHIIPKPGPNNTAEPVVQLIFCFYRG
ncbi:MAG: CvpA family protein [Treponema sp.]|nr:CvpA family protein [Treponema sp.]